MIRAFGDDKERVWCDNCGDEIEHCGWMACTDRGHEVQYCDDCAPKFDVEHEFRICMVCGKPIVEGFTDEGSGCGADFYSCEECFEQAMAETYGEWRKNYEEGYNGGYYDAYEPRECAWFDTGVYWTEWY